MDDIDSACASHDKCINDGDSQYSSGWPTVLAVTARLTRSCSTLKNVRRLAATASCARASHAHDAHFASPCGR